MNPVLVKIDEKYLDKVPRLLPEERKLLKESIMINGQREEIIVNQKGIILDGHTRFEICQELGIEPKIKVRQFLNKEQEMDYVIDANLARRQLTKFAKIEMIYDQYKRAAKHSHDGYKAQVFGDKVGVKSTVFHKAIWLIENADEYVKSQLRSGDTAIIPTAQKLRNQENPLKKHYIGKNDIVECPSCKHQFPRKDLRVVKRI